jgi:hypothetical protein
MPRPHMWRLTHGAIFVAITIVPVRNDRPWRPPEPLTPQVGSPSEDTNNPVFVSELSRDGRPMSAGSHEAIRIAARRAKGLFIATRWDEFVATAEPSPNARGWTVCIEPKSGERDDILSLTVEDGRVTRFAFRRRYKLNGYTGKSKKGASPGYCRIDRG